MKIIVILFDKHINIVIVPKFSKLLYLGMSNTAGTILQLVAVIITNWIK